MNELELLLKEKKIEKVATDKLSITKIENTLIKEDDLDLSIGNLTDNEKINEKIRKSILDFSNQVAKTNIWYGKHLQEMFELLGNGDSGNQYTSAYTKYLGIIGINYRTAKRYRKRYELYNSNSSERVKKLALLISDKDIEVLEQNPYLLEEIEKEKIENKEELKLLIATEIEPEKKIEVLPPTFNLDNFSLNLDKFKLKFDRIKEVKDERKLKKLEGLLLKIDEILEG